MHRERERLHAIAARLDSLSPLAVLGRGYTIARKADGHIVRRAADVQPGDQLSLRLEGDDVVLVQVTQVKPGGK